MKTPTDFDCELVLERLPLYVGGDLDAGEPMAGGSRGPSLVDRIEGHLASCAGCRAAADAARRAQEAFVRGLERAPRPDGGLWGGVRAALVEEGILGGAPERRPAGRLLRLVPAGVGLAAAAALAFFYLQPGYHAPAQGPSLAVPAVVDPSPVAYPGEADALARSIPDGGMRRVEPGEETLLSGSEPLRARRAGQQALLLQRPAGTTLVGYR